MLGLFHHPFGSALRVFLSLNLQPFTSGVFLSTVSTKIDLILVFLLRNNDDFIQILLIKLFDISVGSSFVKINIGIDLSKRLAKRGVEIVLNIVVSASLQLLCNQCPFIAQILLRPKQYLLLLLGPLLIIVYAWLQLVMPPAFNRIYRYLHCFPVRTLPYFLSREAISPHLSFSAGCLPTSYLSCSSY